MSSIAAWEILGLAGLSYCAHRDSRIARISWSRKFTLTTCAIRKRPVPGLPAHNSRQRAQTSVTARTMIALIRRWNFPTSASAHVISERVIWRAWLCGVQDSFRWQDLQLVLIW